MFRKSKLMDSRPSWPELNFHGKCRNMMLYYLPKPVLCRPSLNSLWKRRPAKEENHCLLLWERTREITIICVSNLVLRRIILDARTCFSPQSRRARLMQFSQSCMCECVGLPTEYCELRISQTEFVVLLEGKTEPFISCIHWCQVPCLVLKSRRVKVKRDSSTRFKCCQSMTFFLMLNPNKRKLV